MGVPIHRLRQLECRASWDLDFQYVNSRLDWRRVFAALRANCKSRLGVPERIRYEVTAKGEEAVSKPKRTTRDVYVTPTYTVSEAAGFLFLPTATLRSWLVGRDYPTSGGTKRFAPLIRVGRGRPILLSFRNVVEAHVLSAIRREHGVAIRDVRPALSYVARTFSSKHPLADQEFQTDGVHLFVERYGSLVNASEEGQVEMRELLEGHLERIERSPDGVPIRLYPFTRFRDIDEPRPVTIDPCIAFGRPVLSGTGIPTAVLADRFNCGETIDELARDYGRPRGEIEEAIRFERHTEAA